MDIMEHKILIVVILVGIAVLWVLFKALKLIWKFVFVFMIFLGLSFALPAMREWIFGLF